MYTPRFSSKSYTSTAFFWMSALIHFIIIVLFFDAKVHIGGDDSDYIMSGLDFLRGENFPSWHGSLYPIFLSGFMSIMGVKLIVLKVVSIGLVLSSFYLFYLTFKDQIDLIPLGFSLLILATNYHIAYYASTTYSEPLFLFLQSLLFYIFYLIHRVNNVVLKKSTILLWFSLVLIMFLLSITRNIGFGVCVAILIYLFTIKRFREAILITILFSGLHHGFSIYKKVFWNFTGSGIAGQLSKIAYKNPYDSSKGVEDFSGFIVRFWDNSNLYLSKHTAKMLGFRLLEGENIYPLLTVFLYLILLITLYITFKRHKFLFFTALYICTMCTVTFVTQQKEWDQYRLIMVYLPLIAVCFSYTIYALLCRSNHSIITKYLGMSVLILLPIVGLINTINAPKIIFTSIQNINSDRHRFKGYDEDWKNYAQLSEWIGKNLPDSSIVLCRKPGISGVYGEKKFKGISRIKYPQPDSVVAYIERNNIEFILRDGLRMNTVSRFLNLYLNRKPLGLKLIKTIGNHSHAMLLQVCNDKPRTEEEYWSRITTGIQIAPKSPYFYILAGDFHIRKALYGKSIQFYSAAIGFDGGNYEVYYRRAISYANLGDKINANKDLEYLIQQDPNNLKYQQLALQVNTIP